LEGVLYFEFQLQAMQKVKELVQTMAVEWVVAWATDLVLEIVQAWLKVG
jgi:hypothetical protein